MIKDWGNIDEAKVLVIGHDPRLKKSNTIAEFVLFADYYAENKTQKKEKYGLAKSTFTQIFDLTNNKFDTNHLYITNLCNEELSRPTTGKTVYITQEHAMRGINHIKEILKGSHIQYIFPTSQQVNYWLQKLGFYTYVDEYIKGAEPSPRGIYSEPPYYVAKRSSVFREYICGNIYDTIEGKHKVIPILHPKHYPLKGNFSVFQQNYERIKTYFK